MKELKMTKSASLIQLLMREPLTTCTERTLPLKVLPCFLSSCRLAQGLASASVLVVQVGISAVFSKFCITPAKGISFQPTTYNTQSAPRGIELANTGVFPFQFKLVNLGGGEATPTRPDSKEGKGKGAKGKGDGASALQVGAFSVRPMQGTVAAGSSAQLQVFIANFNKTLESSLC